MCKNITIRQREDSKPKYVLTAISAHVFCRKTNTQKGNISPHLLTMFSCSELPRSSARFRALNLYNTVEYICRRRNVVAENHEVNDIDEEIWAAYSLCPRS